MRGEAGPCSRNKEGLGEFPVFGEVEPIGGVFSKGFSC